MKKSLILYAAMIVLASNISAQNRYIHSVESQDESIVILAILVTV